MNIAGFELSKMHIICRIVIKVFYLSLAFIWSLHVHAQSSARLESMRFIKEGDNFLRMGNWNDAMASYSSSIIADPSYADGYMKRAMLNERLGSQTDADYIHLNRGQYELTN